MPVEDRVWIVQCLCPARHCIAAITALRPSAKAAADLEAILRATVTVAIAGGAFNPWCALCRARAETFRYEVSPTRFRTMAEAEPEMRRLQAEQAAVNALFGDMPGKPH